MSMKDIKVVGVLRSNGYLAGARRKSKGPD